MLDFIQNNQEDYTNDINMNYPESSGNIDIIANGKTYTLYYKLMDDFFNKLAAFLKLKNCD